MKLKKDLTIAALLGMVGVPVFGAVNVKNAHAAYQNQNGVMLTNSEARRTNPQYVYRPGHGIGRGDSGPVFGQPGEEDDTIGHYNGHSFHFPDNGGWIVSQLDGKNNPSLASVNAALHGDNNSNGHNLGTTDQSSSTKSNGENSNFTQYASKNELPQTSEVNNKAKSIALGAVLAGASAVALGASKKLNRGSKEIVTNKSVASGNNSLDSILANINHNINKLNKLMKD